MKLSPFLIFSLLLGSVNAHSIEIDNFKSGLICTDLETFGWVCHETEEVYVTGQSKCEFNKESKPCTWHGFEFDYKGHEKGDVIECKFKMSHPVSLGNPNEKEVENISTHTFELEVPYGDGHFYNPQYVVLSVAKNEANMRVENTVCYFNEKEIFRYKKTYVYPQNP